MVASNLSIPLSRASPAAGVTSAIEKAGAASWVSVVATGASSVGVSSTGVAAGVTTGAGGCWGAWFWAVGTALFADGKLKDGDAEAGGGAITTGSRRATLTTGSCFTGRAVAVKVGRGAAWTGCGNGVAWATRFDASSGNRPRCTAAAFSAMLRLGK